MTQYVSRRNADFHGKPPELGANCKVECDFGHAKWRHCLLNNASSFPGPLESAQAALGRFLGLECSTLKTAQLILLYDGFRNTRLQVGVNIDFHTFVNLRFLPDCVTWCSETRRPEHHHEWCQIG